VTREGCELRERFQPTLVSALVSVRVPTIFQCWVRRRGDSNSASKTRADHRRWDQRQHVRSPTAYMLPCPVGLRIGSGPWLSQILRRNKPKRRADNRRNRFEDGSKAVPGCSLLLQAVPGKNEIREFVRHGAPGYPTGVHGFAANAAAHPFGCADAEVARTGTKCAPGTRLADRKCARARVAFLDAHEVAMDR